MGEEQDMRIISKRALKDFWLKHPQAEVPLNDWFRFVKKAEYNNLVELRNDFPHADLVGKYMVFNIAGNKFRLIAAIHFNTKTVFIREVLTHADYDKGRWNK